MIKYTFAEPYRQREGRIRKGEMLVRLQATIPDRVKVETEAGRKKADIYREYSKLVAGRPGGGSIKIKRPHTCPTCKVLTSDLLWDFEQKACIECVEAPDATSLGQLLH